MPVAFQRTGNLGPADPAPDPRSMSHAQILLLRNSLAPDDPRQLELAPLEHAAFAREWTAENPLVAVPALAVSIPSYTAAKSVGLVGARTPGNISEMVESFRGVGRGLRDAYNRSRR